MGFLDKDGLAYLWEKVTAALSGKQNILTGSSGQLVGFDAEGKAVARDAPSGGMTQAEADARYLKLSGGTVTGELTVGRYSRSKINIIGYDGIKDTTKTFTITPTSDYIVEPGLEIGGMADIGLRIPGIVLGGDFYANYNRIMYLGDPIAPADAANKQYVDQAIAGTIPTGDVTKVQALTQEEYEALATKDATTLYLITG